MSNRVFIISDTHFGHKNILRYESKYRPFSSIEEHDAELVRRWNAVVKKHDTVWHLGDVLFGESSFSLLGQLNGVKRLVLGNHDNYPIQKYAEHFSSIHGCTEIRGCLLTHMPVHLSQFARYRANLHGHVHSRALSDSRYICVCAELTDLAPVLLDKILQGVAHAQRLPSQ